MEVNPGDSLFIHSVYMWPIHVTHRNRYKRAVHGSPVMVEHMDKYYLAQVVANRIDGASVIITDFISDNPVTAQAYYIDLQNQFQECVDKYNEK